MKSFSTVHEKFNIFFMKSFSIADEKIFNCSWKFLQVKCFSFVDEKFSNCYSLSFLLLNPCFCRLRARADGGCGRSGCSSVACGDASRTQAGCRQLLCREWGVCVAGWKVTACNNEEKSIWLTVAVMTAAELPTHNSRESCHVMTAPNCHDRTAYKLTSHSSRESCTSHGNCQAPMLWQLPSCYVMTAMKLP